MQMLGPATIDNVSSHLDPSVRLETIRFLPCSDAQICIQASAPEHTAEDERLFQAGRKEKKIRGSDRVQVRDSSRDIQSIWFARLRILHGDARFLENNPAKPEAKQAHREPCNRQRDHSFEHNSTLESAQTTKPAKPLHHL